MLMYAGHIVLPVCGAVDGDEDGNLNTQDELINIADINRAGPIPEKNMYGKPHPDACWMWTSHGWFYVALPFDALCLSVNAVVKEMCNGGS